MTKQKNKSGLTPLSLSVMLSASLNRHHHLANNLLKTSGISFRELAALSVLTDEMGTVVFAQKDSGRYLGISDATTSRLIIKLREKRLIHYTAPSTFDARANTLFASPTTLNYLNKYTLLMAILDNYLEAELKDYGIVAPKILINQY